MMGKARKKKGKKYVIYHILNSITYTMSELAHLFDTKQHTFQYNKTWTKNSKILVIKCVPKTTPQQ